MKSYKDPSFQDRIGRAADAKRKALDALRSKPPVDEKILAERKAAQDARDAAAAEKREAKKATEEAAKVRRAQEREAQDAASAAAAAAAPAPRTEAELKAARDARYAARKKRK
jgi:hypothetical protein